MDFGANLVDKSLFEDGSFFLGLTFFKIDMSESGLLDFPGLPWKLDSVEELDKIRSDAAEMYEDDIWYFLKIYAQFRVFLISHKWMIL